MAINVEITKNNNESTPSIIRRFSKQVRESGILPRVREIRFFERKPSKYKKKVRALKRMERAAEVETLKKLGRM